MRLRRLTDEEGQRLVCLGEGKGKAGVVRYQRASAIRAYAACLDPRWASGRPRRSSPDDEAFIVETAGTRPEKLGRPFTRTGQVRSGRLECYSPLPFYL